MKCTRCNEPAFLRVDNRTVLCAACWNEVEARFIEALEIPSSCGGSSNLPEPCADVSSDRYDPLNWEVKGATSQSDPQDSNTSAVPRDVAPVVACSQPRSSSATGASFPDIPNFLRRTA